MFCEKCGKQINDKERFCPECGRPTVRNSPGAAPQAPLQQEAQNTVPLQPVNVQPQPQGAWGQPGQQGGKPAGRKWYHYVIGVVAGLLIFASVAFVVEYFLWQKEIEAMKDESTVSLTEEEMRAQGMIPRMRYLDEVNGQGQNSSAETTGQSQNSSPGTTAGQTQSPANGTAAQTENAPSAQDPIRATKAAGLTTVAERIDDYHLNRILQLLKGDWYDDRGAKAVNFSKGRINDCDIAGIFDVAGGGGLAAATFRLRDKGQEWDVRISWEINNKPGDAITINGGQTFHRK